MDVSSINIAFQTDVSLIIYFPCKLYPNKYDIPIDVSSMLARKIDFNQHIQSNSIPMDVSLAIVSKVNPTLSNIGLPMDVSPMFVSF